MRFGWVRNLTTGRVIAISIVFTVLLLALGAAVAARVAPSKHVYEMRMVVGTRQLSAQQVPYYANATLSLAETYARYVTEAGIAGIDAKISASVIADTPVIRIQASATNDGDARKAAERAGSNLLDQVNASTSERLKRLSNAVEDAAQESARLEEAAAKLEKGHSKKRVQIAADTRLAKLRLVAASEAYRDAQVSSLSPSTQLTVIQPPYEVTESLPRPIILGGVIGAVLGGLLCLAWFSSRAKRPSVG